MLYPIMNAQHFFSLLIGIVFPVFLWGQDLPNPDPNIQLIEAGSYIIPMDNEKQTIVAPNGNDVFNIKAYGLIYHLLENEIPIKWIIRSGKGKDEIDFTAYSRRIFPSPAQPDTLDYRASAFVIDINDMFGSACQVNADPMAEVNTIVADFGEDIEGYLLLESVEMDVRYELTSAPVIGVLIDGALVSSIHQTVLDDSEIPYDELSTQDFIDDNGCYTFIGQAHISGDNVSNSYANGVKTYVENGGNFFAQCQGLISYESEVNMQSTNGFGFGSFYIGAGTNLLGDFLNNDLAMMQFESIVDLGDGGTSFYYLSGGSTLQTYAYGGVVDMENNGTIINYLTTGADLNDSIPGGNIWYAAGHDYSDQFFSGNQSS